ncbi:MAG: methyl-accepting chemotaxis protein [Phycisphaerales bacterium]
MLQRLNRTTPLRVKLFGGFGLLIVLAFVTGGTSVILSARSAEETQAVLDGPVAERGSAERARSALYHASQIENEFFLDNDLAHVAEFAEAVGKVESELGSLTSMERGAYWEPKVKVAMSELSEYQQLFSSVTALMKARGLSEKEGLEGQLRSAVHTVESSLADTEHDELTVLMLMCRRHEKDYLMRGDAEKYIGRISQRLAEFEEAVERLQIPAEQRETWAKNWDVYFQAINELADAEAEIAETREQLAGVHTQLEEQIDLIVNDAPDATSNLTNSLAFAKRVSVAMLIMTGIIGVGIAVLISRSITIPIRRLTGMSNALADGDLTVDHVELETNDDLGMLAGSMNTLRDSLIEIVRNLQDSATQIASTTTQVAGLAKETHSGMGHQTQLVEQCSAAIIELSSSADEVAIKSKQAAEHANASGESANQGSAVVDSTIKDMQKINDAVRAGSTSVSELGRRSEEIGQVIAVINDIADQTNLLALNAAIEAARAGEHGRGFAVVADEVRKLADRTTQATEEVEQSITAIRKDTASAVEQMHQGTECVDSGVEQASAAGESLSQIKTYAVDLSEMVSSIAAATNEQSAASSDVSRTIQEITSVTNQVSSSANESAQAMDDLAHRATALNEIANRFRI